MRVLFVQDSGINESLALTELSAVLKRDGHQTRLLLSDEEPRLDDAIRAWDPQLAVLPCALRGAGIALSLASAVRRASPGCFVLLGGTHPTFSPEIAEHPDVHAVFRGEAEGPVGALVAALEAGAAWQDLPGLAHDTASGMRINPMPPVQADLDALPMPDRDLYFRYAFLRRFGWKKFATGRGCVHACAFCFNTRLRAMTGPDRFIRRKSPARAVAEVAAVAASATLRNVHFSDDLFTWRPAWLEEFADLYPSRVGLPFTCNSSVELVSPQAVRALARAGCRGVAIGVETGDAELRARILGKTVSDEQIRTAARLIKDAGMELTTFNMLASPGETLDGAMSTLRLNQEIGADHVRVNIAIPVPNTDFAQGARQAEGVGGAATPAGVDADPVAFHPDDAAAFINLFHLFRPAARHPRLLPLVERVARLPLGRALSPLRLAIPMEERRIFHLGWVEGLRFFRHVGDVNRRTTNYVTLI
jgi:anaerobic magnesium-protoporphyrin IX monomethyl ester cyclase